MDNTVKKLTKWSLDMHVLLVSYEFPPAMAVGGIGSYMQHMALLLHEKGHKVSVISASSLPYNQVINRLYCTNYLITVSDQEQFRSKALDVFEEYFKENLVDVIESPEVGACAIEIKRKYPHIPLLVRMHGPGVLIIKKYNLYQSNYIKIRYVLASLAKGKIDLGYWSKYDKNREKNIEYQICLLADKLLSPSNALKQWALTYWKLSMKEIEVLPNPFTLDSDLLNTPIERDTKQICFVGKLTVLKGMFSLTPALFNILKNNANYRVVFIGRDESFLPNIPSVKNWMQKVLEPFKDRVSFLGVLSADRVKVALKQSDIVVVPSLWETYPTVILEAMAAGCAVTASRCGGIPEIITHRVNGLLFDPMKSKSIEKQLQLLIINKKLRLNIATKGREWVKLLNEGPLHDKTVKIYQELVYKVN